MKLVPRLRPGRELRLTPLGEVDHELLDWLGPELDRRFETSFSRISTLDLCKEWRGRGGGQFRSDLIVDALLDRMTVRGEDPEDLWVLGITSADLCTPDRPWVFGEATVGGCCAVVSTARLDTVDTGTEPRTLRTRLLKEAVHELGHVAGLGHCANPSCVMAESHDLAEIDRKGSDFCPSCTTALRPVR